MDLWGNEDWWDREAEEKKPPEETDYEGMEREFYHCRACPLRREGGHGPVLSTGPCPAPLMLSGRALAVWKMNKDCRLSGRPDSFLTGPCCL
ncbi:hypothetical protein [Allisonella histaminiformans]|uniref:hypothetical protein n=1 Tax=Allisonella histaminiformans TaxID=209880 RepID=UPI00388F0664